jgi:hypothetical protein
MLSPKINKPQPLKHINISTKIQPLMPSGAANGPNLRLNSSTTCCKSTEQISVSCAIQAYFQTREAKNNFSINIKNSPKLTAPNLTSLSTKKPPSSCSPPPLP